MKTKGNLSKIVSSSMALMLCSAMLLFASVMLGSIATPAHAQTYGYAHAMGGAVTSTPTSGSAGTKITVTGSGITTNVFPSPTTPSIAPTVGTVTSGSVTFGYSTDNCGTFNSVGGSNPAVVIGAFTGTFTWPSGLTVGTKYNVCARITAINGSTASETLASSDTFQDLLSASVSVDHGSYTVGDKITVTGSTFPDNTSVTVELQSSDGATTKTLGTVTTDSNGNFTHSYTVPKHPLNSVVVIVTDANGTTLATSSSFTVKAKAKSSSPPPPSPTQQPSPQQQYIPPPVVAAPTPTPVLTTAPTPVPTDTPVPPTPTVAPTPAPVATVAPSTPFSNLMSGKLPLMLGIGLATLIALGILFVVGRLVLSQYLSLAPPNLPPSGARPWTLEQDNSLQGNTGVPLETIPLNSPYRPDGGFGSGPDNSPQPQQVPFNAPFTPANSGFGPGPDNGQQPQQIPFNAPFTPANSGFGPGPDNGQQPQQIPFNAPFTPANSGFGSGPDNGQQPQQVPFNGPYAPGNSPQPQLPFPSSNDWFPPPQ